MKIVPIFAQRLWALHYDGEVDNEYDRLMILWTDPSYLKSFLEANQLDLPPGKTIHEMINHLYKDSETLDDGLIELSHDHNQKIETFFKPLYNSEYLVSILSKQKARKNYLRLYAIRIDSDCFVITGGAIKLTQTMNERPHTQMELEKLEGVRTYLQKGGVSDLDSFFEFLSDPSHDE